VGLNAFLPSSYVILKCAYERVMYTNGTDPVVVGVLIVEVKSGVRDSTVRG
jgi:hypothetical protein